MSELELRRYLRGRFRYSDLKEAAPGRLWDLYPDEPVLIVCWFAIAVRACGFQQRVVERMVADRYIGECRAHNHTAF
jgi:hypothetical protein